MRGRLVLLVAAVLLPPLLLIGWTIAELYQRDREAIQEQLLADTRSASHVVDAFLESRQALLHGLAASQALAQGDLMVFRERAASAVPQAEAWVVLIDPVGNELLNTHLDNATPAERAELLTTALREPPADQAWVSNLEHCPIHGHHVLYVAVPAVVGGQPDHVLALAMTPDAVNRLLERIRSPSERIVALVDRNHRVLARNRRADEFVGVLATPRVREARTQRLQGMLEDNSLEGSRSVVAFSTSRFSGWTVVMAAPVQEAFAMAQSLLSLAGMASSLSVAAAVVLALWIGYGVVRSVQTLVRLTDALGRGSAVPELDTGMTETNQVAQALQAASTQLARHEADLSRSRDEAVAASRAKDDFLAALSHELRTPLNPVLLLASDASTNPELTLEQARAAFGTIAKNVALEARLIDDLLDLTRVSRGLLRIDAQLVDAHAVLRDALSTVELETAEKRIEVAVFASAPRRLVTADPARLQQVFWNLLKNATKFTPAGGRIEIRTSNPDGDTFQLAVRDTGLGMTPEEVSTCFNSFSQGMHRLGGLGLGLAICRELLRLMNGRIEATSAGRGAGATFVVALPVAPAEPGHATVVELTPYPRPMPQPETLLLVEDHEASRMALARALRRRGHQVATAGTVAEALKIFGEQPVTLVISDIGLPDGDGYALIKRVQELRPEVRGVAISGYGMEDDVRRGQAAGFAAHLVKPVNVEELDSTLRRLREPVADGRE